MKININLLGQSRKYDRKIRRQLQFLRYFALILLFGISAFSIALFLLIASSPLPNLQKDENAARFELERLHPKMAKYFVVNDQLSHIDSVLKNRKDYNAMIDLLEEGMPETLAFQALVINDQTVSFTFTSLNLEDFDSLLEKIDELTTSRRVFRQVLIDSFSVNPLNGRYSLVLAVTP